MEKWAKRARRRMKIIFIIFFHLLQKQSQFIIKSIFVFLLLMGWLFINYLFAVFMREKEAEQIEVVWVLNSFSCSVYRCTATVS